MEKNEAIAWMKENERLAAEHDAIYTDERGRLVRRLRLLADELENIDKLHFSNEAHNRFLQDNLKYLTKKINLMRDANNMAQAFIGEANRTAQLYDIVRD